MATISLNVLAQFVRDRNRLLAVIQALQPRALLIMDDVALAGELARAMPRCAVIHRAWHRDDAEFHRKWTPGQFIEAYCAGVPEGVIVQALNEPSGYGDLRQLAAWCANVMALSAQRGVRVAVPNFAVGHPDEHRIPELDVLLKAFDAYPQHLLAVHEYAQVSMTAEVPFHIGRYRALLARCRQLGLKPPRVVVTEFGRDIGGGANDGWRGAGFSQEQYAAFLTSGMNAVYANDGVDTCIFAYGAGANGHWQSFNVEGADALMGSLVEFNRANLMPTDYGQMYDATVTGAYSAGSVVRSAPAATGAELTRLFAGDSIRISTNFEANGGYNWHKVVKDGVEGYAADTDALAWERVPEADPDAPLPDVPDGLFSPFLSADEVRQLIALHTALAAGYRVQAGDHDGIAALYRAALERV